MRGVGPMLPVVAGKERLGRSSSIWNLRRSKRKYFPKNPSEPALSEPTPPAHKYDSGVETSDESTSVSMSSEVRTAVVSSGQSTAVASSKDVKSLSSQASHHRRDPSLIVNFDVENAAQQLRDGEISDLDLALFAFWIRAKDDNYFTARKLIRELALDQGYNVKKITNASIRKLLQDLHDIRPRDPRHTLTPRGSFLSQTPASNARASCQTIVPLSPHTPHTPRIENLPQSLRLRREYAVEEAAQPCSPTYDITEYEYPPNTPDRPAPLSVKLRNSQDSDRTITPKTISRGRSVSAPITPETARETLILPPTYHYSPKHNHSPTKHQRSSGVNDKVTGTTMECSDVFDHASASSHTKGSPFIDRLESGDRRYGSLTSSKYPVGPYQLDASDAASMYSNDTIRETPRRNNDRAGGGVDTDTSIMEDQLFDTLGSYSGTDNEWGNDDADKHSLLETASVSEADRSPTKYRYGLFPKIKERSPTKRVRFASPEITGRSSVKEHIPTSPKRHDSPQITKRSKVQGVESTSLKPNIASGVNSLSRNFKLNVAATSLQQQRSLRRYESEANLSSNAGSQAASGHIRFESEASTADSAGQAPDVPIYKTKARDDEQIYYGRISCRTRIPEPVSRGRTSTRQHVTNEPPLSAFPIPPMSNPVGELPMLLSRASEVPRDEEQTASQYLVQDTSIAKAKETINTTLKRTQARARQLRIIEWESIPRFEQSWRDRNKALLVTIFGRKDTELEFDDYNYIDFIANQLRNDKNLPAGWVDGIFARGG